MANAIRFHYMATDVASTVHIVTRLDKDTSGIVLVAKHRHIHHLFSLSQKQGNVSREYEAIAHGVFTDAEGVIEAPIGRKETSIIERMVREDGRHAKTRYRVVKQFGAYAHLRLQLETGRTHQIRVHLSHIGHPLEGGVMGHGVEEVLYTPQCVGAGSLKSTIEHGLEHIRAFA